jgi:hypothetical protein
MIRNRTKKPLAISLKGVRKGVGGDMIGAKEIMYNLSLISIVTTNPLCKMNIS